MRFYERLSKVLAASKHFKHMSFFVVVVVVVVLNMRILPCFCDFLISVIFDYQFQKVKMSKTY